MTDTTNSIAVIVGASGGIGRAFAEALTADPRYDRVVALSRRRPDGWADDHHRAWLPVDILEEESLAAAAKALDEMGRATRIIVATGMLHGQGLAPEKSLKAVTAQSLASLFAVNTIGPTLVAKHLLPLTPRDTPSLFAALSARVGSIGDNHLGGWHAYRASKAALNMLIKGIAIEHARTRPLGVCVALHPGTVATDLSAPFQSNVAAERLFTPEHAAAALLAVMNGLGPASTGGFFAWDGQSIPW